jgi:hypothetical protein
MEILAALGRFNQDAAQTMGGVFVGLVLFAYWILKT